MSKGAQHWLTLDIMDYLMERPFDIGTNFATEFPNSYVKEFEDYSEIVLLTEDNEEAGTILLKVNPKWEKLHG
jgi:hypothetical protein